MISVGVISLSLRLRLITPTSILIILDITAVLRQGINEVLGNACDGREGSIVKWFCSRGSLFPETKFSFSPKLVPRVFRLLTTSCEKTKDPGNEVGFLPAWFHCGYIKSNR